MQNRKLHLTALAKISSHVPLHNHEHCVNPRGTFDPIGIPGLSQESSAATPKSSAIDDDG